MIITESIQYQPEYHDIDGILQIFSDIEMEYNKRYRFNFKLFNMHLSRSGGTSICGWFKSRALQQKSNKTDDEKLIRLEQKTGSNCNVNDGVPFFWFNENSSYYFLV